MDVWWFRLFIRHKSVSFITVENIRVGLTLRALQVGVMTYAAFMVFNQKMYMEKVVPTGQSNMWIENYAKPQVAPEYCNNSNYDFFYSPEWEYFNNLCKDFMYGEVINKLESGGVYVSTYTQSTVSESSGCDWSGAPCKNSSSVTTNFFTTGVDDIKIAVVASYSSKFKDGKDMETTLKRQDGSSFQVFEPGEPVIVSLKDALDIAGISSLDARNERAYVSTSTGHATYRMTGVLLRFEYSFTNTATMNASHVTASLRIKSGNTGWTGRGSGIDYTSKTFQDKISGEHSYAVYQDYSYGIKNRHAVLWRDRASRPRVNGSSTCHVFRYVCRRESYCRLGVHVFFQR